MERYSKFYYLRMDNVLVKLEESGYGCHIRLIFMGALSYADDITLLSHSLRGINEMIHICSLYADTFDITYNSEKKYVSNLENRHVNTKQLN